MPQTLNIVGDERDRGLQIRKTREQAEGFIPQRHNRVY